MKLKELKIELQQWGENKGQYEAEIEYEGDKGKVKLLLDSKVSEALLLVIGPVITKFAHQSALVLEEAIVKSVQESRNLPVIENKEENAT